MSKPISKFMNQYGIILLLSTLLLGACASAAPAQDAYELASPASAPQAPMAGSAAEMESIGYDAALNSAPGNIERLVIQNANISLAVEDPGASMDRIASLAQQMGGFVVSKNLYQQTLDSGIKVPRASITIRVPAESLNEALAQVKNESSQDPISESSDSQDVTSEYTDLQSRLRNLENTELQLNRIMEEAVKTEDILSVYNQLVQIREQIEVTKGRIQYFEQSAALSAISVELLADEAVQPLSIGSWQPQGVAKSAVQSLINTLKFIANAIIWIVIYILPVLLAIYVVFYLPISFVWRRIRKPTFKRKQDRSTQPPSNPDQR
jgi:hypothetical protein